MAPHRKRGIGSVRARIMDARARILITVRTQSWMLLCSSGLQPRTLETNTAIGVQLIPVDSEGFAFKGTRGQNDEPHVGDGVDGLSGGACPLTI